MSNGVKILLIGVLTGLLAACGSGYDSDKTQSVDSGTGTTSSVMVDTVDGRTIPCVVWRWGPAGGISCDWSAK